MKIDTKDYTVDI